MSRFNMFYYDDTGSLTLAPGAPESPLSPFIPNPGSPCIRRTGTLSIQPHVNAFTTHSICSCSLTLGPGIPCSPWKTCVSEFEQLQMQTTNLTWIASPWIWREISTHHRSRRPGNPWWASWAWLRNHLNLNTIAIRKVKRFTKWNQMG